MSSPASPNGNSPLAHSLNTLYGDYQGSLPFDLNGELIEINNIEDIPDGARALPTNQDGLFFCVAFTNEAQRDDYLTCKLEPSLALFHSENKYQLLIWALDKPYGLKDEKIATLPDLFDMDIHEGIPLPGQDGWDVVHNSGIPYQPIDLFRVYIPKDGPEVAEASAEIESPPVIDDSKKFFDAVIKTPFSPDDCPGSIWVTIGKDRKAYDWYPNEKPLIEILGMLCRHEEGTKDGVSFVYANMVQGQRLKNAVKTISAIGLDIDNGIPTDQIDAVLAPLGCLAVRYSTHSHLTTHTEYKKDEIFRFEPDAEVIDTDLMRRFLARQKNWYEPLVDTVEYDDEIHASGGIMVRVKHAPMHKNRIIIPLLHPYEIAKEAKTQIEAMAKWKKYPEALAALLKLPFDISCTDPSRIFYPPRHPQGRTYSISLFGGPLLDKASLKLDSSFESVADWAKKKGSKSKTEEGRALGKWHMKFGAGCQITDIIQEYCPDKLRGPASSGFHIECPFDGGHRNPGDPGDRACFAVNAADGGNEWPIISCRHESCEGYTYLDMMGKMIKDGWFERPVIEDLTFNILKFTEEEKEKVEEEREAEKEKEEARASYLGEIDKLAPNPSDADLERVVALVIAAELSANMFSQARDRIAKQTKKTKTVINTTFKEIREGQSTGTEKNCIVRTGLRTIFRHSGYHFDEAVDVCVQALDNKNKRDKLPTFSSMGRNPVFLTITAEGRAEFHEMTVQSAWSNLTDMVSFVRVDEDGKDSPRAKVPEDVAKHIYEQSYKLLRQSPTVVYTPVFLKDGSLLETPAYHYDEKDPGYLNHLLILRNGLVVPKTAEGITKDQALASLEWLRVELLNDFPFCDFGDNGEATRDASEAHALAMIITPFMRDMIPGRTPVFFINKPKGGTGGSLLGSLSMLLFDGEVGPVARYSDNPEEQNKIIVTAILSGDSHLFFDDVEEFTSKELHRNITAVILSGRILGTNTRVECKNNKNWIAGGNNVKIDEQMDRRLVHIRMNARTANLQERKFRHGGDTPESVSKLTLEEFVSQNRGISIGHILTLIQYWIEQGEVPFTARKRIGFEKWCEKVGGVLQCVDINGFLDNKSGVTASQEYAADMEFIGWWNRQEWSETPKRAATIWDAVFGEGLEIISGHNQDQKREKFFTDLRRLEGQTFPIEDALSGKTFEYMVVGGKDGTYHLSLCSRDNAEKEAGVIR